MCTWFRVQTCKLLRRPAIDSMESIPPAYVAWRAGTPQFRTGPPGWESIPELRKRFTNSGSGRCAPPTQDNWNTTLAQFAETTLAIYLIRAPISTVGSCDVSYFCSPFLLQCYHFSFCSIHSSVVALVLSQLS